MIISRTPFRMSFFGGGTDFPAWYLKHGSKVLAATIDKYCYISCRYLPPFFEHKYRMVYSKIETARNIGEIEHPAIRAVLGEMECDRGLEIHHDGDLPARSGLGSSSAFTVGLINAIMALNGRYISKEDIAKQAIHIEQNVIKENVGSQDQVLTAYGGFNKVEFKVDGSFEVSPIIMGKEKLSILESHFMLFFTGFSRIASDVEKSKIQNMDKKTTELFAIRAMVDEALSILVGREDVLDEFGKLLHQAWLFKRSLSEKVSTPEIDLIYETALRSGATGGKILGAGGGGFLLLYVKPEFQTKVKESLRHLIHVPFQFESSGTKIVLYQPSGWV